MRAVVFDLDGVLRHPVDPTAVTSIEDRWGLAAGVIEECARSEGLLEDLILGSLSRAGWIQRVGEMIGSHGAADEWAGLPLHLDTATADIAAGLHDTGVLTAVLTNGTDTVREEIEALGVGSSFDAIFNSAELGIRKPEPRIYEHVLEHLGVAPDEAMMIDDSRSKLEGAAVIGMRIHWFQGAEELAEELCVLGLRD